MPGALPHTEAKAENENETQRSSPSGAVAPRGCRREINNQINNRDKGQQGWEGA